MRMVSVLMIIGNASSFLFSDITASELFNNSQLLRNLSIRVPFVGPTVDSAGVELLNATLLEQLTCLVNPSLATAGRRRHCCCRSGQNKLLAKTSPPQCNPPLLPEPRSVSVPAATSWPPRNCPLLR